MDNNLKENIYTGIGIFIYFISILIPCLIWIVIPLWEFEVFDFSNNKNLYLYETIFKKEAVYSKHHKINFEVFPETQTIIQTNIFPILDETKFNSQFCEVNIKNKECNILENVECYKNKMINFKVKQYKSLPKNSETFSKLKNCTIKDKHNWLCKENIKHVDLPITYFGLKNGSWILNKPIYENNLEKWKTFWYFSKIQCGEAICFLGFTKEIEKIFDSKNRKRG